MLDLSEFVSDDFGEYLARAGPAQGDLWERFNVLGLYAFRRGLDISGGIGLGVGTLAQTLWSISSKGGAGSKCSAVANACP